MTRTIPSAAQRKSWSSAISFAESLLFATRRVVPVLLDAATESDKFEKAVTTRTGAYRALTHPEVARKDALLAEFRRRVDWEVWNFVAGVVFYERYSKPVLASVAALYPVHAPAVRIWDIRAMTGLEAVGRAAHKVLIGSFGADLEVLKMVEVRDIFTTSLRQDLLRRMFPYWPGHYYRTWVGRTADELLDLEVALRREQLYLIGRDSGPWMPGIGDESELSEVSSKGTPEQPSYPMSIACRAGFLGMDPRTLRSAMVQGRYRYQKQSDRLFCFCDAETRPAKPTRVIKKTVKSARRR